MTRRTRQLTTFLLTIALTFSMLPSAAWATDSAEPEPTVAVAETVTGSESEETANRVPVETAAAAQRTKVSTAAQKDGGTSSSADKQLNTCGVLATSSCDPNVTLSTADEIKDGQIRYITQKSTNPYYNKSGHWGSYKAINYCWAACISMSLSYLGIDQLPKDILKKSTNDGKSPTINRGAIYQDEGSLEEMVERYVNGNGAYSPPIITWVNKDCYKTSTGQHVLMIIGKKTDNVYLVTDPLEKSEKKNFIREITVSGNKAKSTKYSDSEKVFTFTIKRVYQYYRQTSTTLENGKLALDGGILREGTALAVRGHIGGSDQISTVTAGCYDLNGDPVKNCNKTVTVNSVGYDLSQMSQSLQFSKLTPGFYEYRITVKMANKTSNVLLRQKFAVRNAKKNLPNATFYFDNGRSNKYCVTAKDSKSGSVLSLSYNTESDSMKIRAQAVGSHGYYRLMMEKNGLYLTVYKSSASSGTKVIQYPKVDKDGQYWQILPGPKDGYYYLMPKCAPTCCLSVTKDAVENGGTLEIRTAKAGNAARYWLLRYTRPLISDVRNVASGVQVSWDVPAYATGYKIYRATGSSSTWKQVKHETSGKTASWVDTKVANGIKYRYKVRALYGGEESPLTPEGHRYRVVRPAKFTAKSNKARKLTAAWSVNTKATGYQLCYATNKSFSNSRTLNISGSSSKSKTITGLSRGKKYYVKVRACKKVGKESYFSAWSAVKLIRVK